ncbi:ClpP/crotonase-like domain-containing protein [Ilyonectria robusta]|uniref:ClpP/crotonase-like domain-containing protein n=1 Tax=Ilyonectria robusta TaxID=1079257 RepID=UPI001E8E212C|nr:ClpP/crotonase-like domain-containing protein [Ilyonectria robusta]KAH8651775.1 ClpP/crotonase-like domain-containing protein [Ilyonectria robusta]
MLFPQILTLAFVTAIFPVAIALQLPDYRALKTSLNSTVLEVTFHNPDAPVVNLWSQDTQDELTDLVERLQSDNETKVVIFKSDVPRFFIAHLDLEILAGPNTNFIYTFATLLYNITTLRQVTIGAVEGRARGAGSELLSALDMRFATRTDTLIAQPELGVGLIPGGGGSQFLTNLIGRGRAMEYILAAKDITASEAEKIGWVNKAFETSADMYAYVDQLTSRLRLFPLTALHEAKKSINRISAPTFEDIYAEAVAFSKQVADPLTQQAMQRSAAVFGNMSLLEAELNLSDWAPAFYQ